MPADLSPEVEAAYRACERLARDHYENFTVASFLLPSGTRRHMAALYGFARGVDDIGDEYGGDRPAALDGWEAHLRSLFGEEVDPPGPRPQVFKALAQTIRACGLPAGPFLRLIEANRRDQRMQRYERWEDLLEYCTYSADPVGRLVLRIFGETDPELVPLSDATCTALQLTNFWQDVARDLAMGRIYLPREDMERFGVEESDLAGPPAGPAFRDLMRFEVERTRPLFREGWELVGRVDGAFRVDLALFTRGGEAVLDAIEGGRISPESPLPPLDAQTVNACEALVAQMGIEPIEEAIRSGCDVILCGRAYDPAVFAAHPVHAGYDKGLAFHLGKILECAAIAADPGSGSDCVLGILREDHFVLEPLSDDRRFTEQSTAAHSLYEKSDPYVLPGPGGRINLSETSFTETGEGTVVVRGSRFEPSDEYYIKLEGVTKKGYRTVSVAGTRDPRMIESVRPILEDVERYSMDLLAKEGIQGSIFFHVYGKDGVMGRLEPETVVRSHELGIVLEAIGATQDQANAICSFVRSALLHYGYPGRISTAGNLAFPFSPSDLQAGAVYEFSVFHLMRIHDQGVFRLQTEELGGST